MLQTKKNIENEKKDQGKQWRIPGGEYITTQKKKKEQL